MAEQLAVGKRFSSFSEIESALNNLGKDGHHPLRVYNSQNGEDYNRSDLIVSIQVNQWMCPSSSTHITVFDVYTTGNLDVVVRGYGLFSGRSLLDAKPKSPSPTCNRGLNCLVVRECDLHHNHRTGEEIYGDYSSVRRLSQDEEKDITEILGLKANSKHIRDLIVRRYGRFVTLKDIQNLKTKVREQEWVCEMPNLFWISWLMYNKQTRGQAVLQLMTV